MHAHTGTIGLQAGEHVRRLTGIPTRGFPPALARPEISRL